MNKYISKIIIVMLLLIFSSNILCYAAAGDYDEIIRKYINNEALTQSEVNKLKTETITSTFYDASMIEMVVEAAKSGTIKVKDSSSTNSSTSNSNNSQRTNKKSGAEYWTPKNQQGFLDMWADNKGLTAENVDVIIQKFEGATSTDINALTSNQLKQILTILDNVNNLKGTSARPTAKQIEKLVTFSNKLKKAFPNSTSDIEIRITKLESMKEVSENEEHNEEVIKDPEKGAVDPNDIKSPIEDKKEGTDAVLGESSASPNHTLDEIIKEGNSFLSQAEKGDKINELTLKSASDTLYNILLVIGIAIAVIIGMYLGAKFILSSAEDKAKVKEALIPYIAGCVVIFGAFVIWKLVIVLLGGIA